MKKIFIIAGIISLVFAFSGCTVFETDTEALMNPPVFTEEQEKLNSALIEVAGEDYVLKYPKNGEINSAFIFEDLDGDGTSEAMAFYSVLDESTRINILKNKNGNWTSVYTAPGFYGEIESIDFVKVDEKGPAIVIKWEQEVGIYRYEKEKLESVHRAGCEGIDIADINGDGYSEVISFSGASVGRTIINVVYGKDGKIEVSENVSIHAEFDEIYSRTSGLLCEGKHAYFLDSEISEGVYLTEIITFENGTAKRNFVADYVKIENEDKEEDPSGIIVVLGGNYGKRGIFLRNTKVRCFDINGDGIIEMPSEVREDYAQEASENIYFVQYIQYNGTEALPVWNGVANSEEGYLFEVPEKWNENIIAKKEDPSGNLAFYEKKSNNKVLEIFAVSKTDYQDEYEEYFFVAEDETKNYYIKSFAEGKSTYYIEPEKYEQSFIFMK